MFTLFFIFLVIDTDKGNQWSPDEGSNEYSKSMLLAKIRKMSYFLSETCHSYSYIYILHMPGSLQMSIYRSPRRGHPCLHFEEPTVLKWAVNIPIDSLHQKANT